MERIVIDLDMLDDDGWVEIETLMEHFCYRQANGNTVDDLGSTPHAGEVRFTGSQTSIKRFDALLGEQKDR